MAEAFCPGTEVVTYESVGDLSQLLPMLLADDTELVTIGEAAWSRVTADHTWSRRWSSLLEPWVIEPEIGRDEDVSYVGQSNVLTRAS